VADAYERARPTYPDEAVAWMTGAGRSMVLELGAGTGKLTEVLHRAGHEVLATDPLPEMLAVLATKVPVHHVVATAEHIPVRSRSVDVVVCGQSFHWFDHELAMAEIARVLRPGGWGYISWTNWYSPWGGHDMSPYHYLGPRLGPRLYERRHGPPRKNRYGAGLWARHIGPTLRLVRATPGLEIERVEPRYWPRLRVVCRVPGLRELVTWNCVIRVRRRAG
jgi:ubiquinone/menaquinone biosynthesis C-methylase UbiE